MRRWFKHLAIRSLQLLENKVAYESDEVDELGHFQFQWFPIRVGSVTGSALTTVAGEEIVFHEDSNGHLMRRLGRFTEQFVGTFNYLTGKGQFLPSLKVTRCAFNYYFDAEANTPPSVYHMTLVSSPLRARVTRLKPSSHTLWVDEQDQNLVCGHDLAD